MAIPNADKRYKAMLAKKIDADSRKENLNCGKQFPDCPETPNDKDCKICPHYKKIKP